MDLGLIKLQSYRHCPFATMATNAGAGAARQLQSARRATAVWKVGSSAISADTGLSQEEIYCSVARYMGSDSESACR